MKRGGDADDFNVHWICKGAIKGIGDLINTEQQHILNSCCFLNQSVGCDFPSCCGASSMLLPRHARASLSCLAWT